jgi:hypothetical protein
MVFSMFNKLKTNEKLLLLATIVGIYLLTTVIFKEAKEGLDNMTAQSSTTTASSCPNECVKPTTINGTCPKTLYKNKDDPTKCYRRCPYECPSTLDKCKTTNYCESCGTVTFDAPCDGTEIIEQVSPSAATSTALNSQIKSKTLDDDLLKIKDLTYKYQIEKVDGDLNVYVFNEAKPPSQALFTDITSPPFSPFINQFTQT